MKYFICLLCLLFLCCHDNCTPESTRCSGDTVQMCNSEKDWYDVIDCTTISPDLWECCISAVGYETEILAGCVLLDTCEIDGGTD